MCATGRLIRDRAPWLKLIVVPNDRGGEDVLLRLDGGHPPDGGAREAANVLREALVGALEADGLSELEIAVSDLPVR